MEVDVKEAWLRYCSLTCHALIEIDVIVLDRGVHSSRAEVTADYLQPIGTRECNTELF